MTFQKFGLSADDIYLINVCHTLYRIIILASVVVDDRNWKTQDVLRSFGDKLIPVSMHCKCFP